VDPELWRKVEDLCQSALELEESQRAEFLARACAGDEALRHKVESLLAHDGTAKHFMESPALEVVGKSVAAESSARRVSLIGTTVSHSVVSQRLRVGRCKSLIGQ
jgi:hypothetical protein